MSGKYSGVQKKSKMWLHILTLNLILKDALEIVIETYQLDDIIQLVYNFFGHSILR